MDPFFEGLPIRTWKGSGAIRKYADRLRILIFPQGDHSVMDAQKKTEQKNSGQD